MKQLFTLLALLVFIFKNYSQNSYNFTYLTEAYSDLENPVNISNSNVWDYDFFGPFTIPFDFKIKDETVSSFAFDDDYFIFLGPNSDLDNYEGLYYIDAVPGAIQDRTASTGNSSSPIGYKVDGPNGHRILKIEMRNAGLENAQAMGFEEDEFFINYQIWLYEFDNSVELRYGQSNITDNDLINDGNIIAGISTDENAFFVSGDASAPTYGEYTESNFPENLSLSNLPVAGTVYRFNPPQAASVVNINKDAFSIYPNPVGDVLNIKSNGSDNHLVKIFDVLGNEIYSTNINAQHSTLNISTLHSGVYMININSSLYKVIKK